MKRLDEVEEAKALMTEAMSWSVMKWLKEKKRVRKAADIANNMLWTMQKETKDRWSGDLRSAYEELVARDGNTHHRRERPGTDASLERLAKAIKEADDAAYAAHLDAEETFDKADRQLSTSKAREGCRKAILSWDLYEKAIAKAETVISKAETAN